MLFKAVMDRAQPDKQGEMQSLLKSTIEKVEKSQFSDNDFEEFKSSVAKFLKPGTADEIDNDLKHFKRQST